MSHGGREGLGLRETDGWRNVNDKRGRSSGLGGIQGGSGRAAGEEAGAERDGGGDEGLEAWEGGRRDHGAEVVAAAEERADPTRRVLTRGSSNATSWSYAAPYEITRSMPMQF